jgi:heme exporter protein A
MSLELKIAALSCSRGGRNLFTGLNFFLRSGDVLAVAGPNGAGKTSLLRQIAGFLPAAAGAVRLTADGKAVGDEECGAHIGWLGDGDALKPQAALREQLVFAARLYGRSGDGGAMLARFGLEPFADLPGRYLSAGQRRRFALARLVLGGRPLWLMDEPMAALDQAGRALVNAAIIEHCAQGGLVVAAGHEALDVPCNTLRLGGAP